MTLTYWSTPPSSWIIGHKDIHIWIFSLIRPPMERAHYWNTLAADEQARANRFYFDKDRFHFVIARGLLRFFLGNYLGIPAVEVLFAYGSNGKPRLDESHRVNGSLLHFNLSHSYGMGLAAFVWDCAIGVDIEKIRPLRDKSDIAKRFFSAWESDTFLNLPVAQQPKAFYNCWTRKEAFVKAIGDGLTYPLDQFDVTLAPKDKAQLLRVREDKIEAQQWHLVDLQVDQEFAAALIVLGHNWRLSQFHWP